MGGSLSKSADQKGKEPSTPEQLNKQPYAVQVLSSPNPNETGVFRRVGYEKALVTSLGNPELQTVQSIFQQKCRDFSAKNFLTYRQRDETGSHEDTPSFLRYGDAQQQALCIGSGLVNLGLIKSTELESGEKLKFIGIYGTNTVNYALVQIACYLYGLTLVPLYEKSELNELIMMINHTQLQTLFISSKHSESISLLMRQGKLPHLQTIVLLDGDESENEKASKCLAGTNYYKLDNLIKSGSLTIQTPNPVAPDDVACCSFTPGTTGSPKAALITHRNIIASIGGVLSVLKPEFELVHLSYISFAHGFELLMFIFVAFCGGIVALFSGDFSKLNDDLSLFKPTIFICIPTVFYRLYDLVQEVLLSANSGCMGTLFKKALRTKLDLVESKLQFTHLLYDKMYFSKFRAMLGGRVRLFIAGSTSVSESAMKLMSVVFSAPFLQGYGFTEGLCAQFVPSAELAGFGHTGGPLPQNEFKLVDVPDQGFFTKSNVNNKKTTIRGELYVRGGNIIKGYLRGRTAFQLEQTPSPDAGQVAEGCGKKSSSSQDTLSLACFEPELAKMRSREISDSFEISVNHLTTKPVLYVEPCVDQQGWHHTGDIAELCPSTSALKILDRKSDVFLLNSKVPICPQDLEKVYLEITGLRDFLITKCPSGERILGVAALDLDSLQFAKVKLGLQISNLIELSQCEPYKEYLLKQIRLKWAAHKLHPWELVEELVLNDGTFEARGLLSPTMKIKRQKAVEYYAHKIRKHDQDLIESRQLSRPS